MTITKRMYRPNHFMHPFDELFNRLATPGTETYRPRYSEPAANVVEQEKAFQIALAVPGMQKEDFSIQLEEQVLTISASVDTKVPAHTKVISREFTYGHFNKSFVLHDTIDSAAISAQYDGGILTITLPKTAESATPLREIKVN